MTIIKKEPVTNRKGKVDKPFSIKMAPMSNAMMNSLLVKIIKIQANYILDQNKMIFGTVMIGKYYVTVYFSWFDKNCREKQCSLFRFLLQIWAKDIFSCNDWEVFYQTRPKAWSMQCLR